MGVFRRRALRSDRLVQPPDLSRLVVPDHDLPPGADDGGDVRVLRHWRTYDDAGNVDAFCYLLERVEPGRDPVVFHKAVRLVRLTRVPRYLRQSSGLGPGVVFDQQRDLLAALAERGVLFLNLIAKAPGLPLVFSYGVQATGSTAEEALEASAESRAVLVGQLDGTFQQLEYAPLTAEVGESLVRFSFEWRHLAVARGRPFPHGVNMGASSLLDGNRTDLENTANQLESFLRGMGDRSFMLSMVTVPVPPEMLLAAWRRLTRRLSQVRSDQQGTRSVSAGVALPLALGTAQADTHGSTHATASSAGTGSSESVNVGISQGSSETHGVSTAVGETHSVGVTETVGHTVGATHSEAATTAATVGHTSGVSHSQTLGVAEQVAHSAGSTSTVGASQSLGETHGSALSHSATESVSQSTGTTQALSRSDTVGSSWGHSVSDAVSTQASHATGVNHSFADAISQTFGSSRTGTVGSSGNLGSSSSSSEGASLALLNSSESSANTTGLGVSLQDALAASMGLSRSGTQTTGVSGTLTDTLGRSVTEGLNTGGSASQTLGASHSVSEQMAAGLARSTGVSESLARSASVTQSLSEAVSQTLSRAASMSEAVTAGQSAAVSSTQSVGHTSGVAQSTAVSTAQGVTSTQSATSTQAASLSRGVTEATTAGVSRGQSVNQILSNGVTTAVARNMGTTASLGVVPTLGVAVTRQTFNESKRILGDLLEAQVARYVEGIESGGFLYQMVLRAPDRGTLLAAAGLMKSAFWGPGTRDRRLPQPFHVLVDLDPREVEAISRHAAVFSSYPRKERSGDLVEPYLYSTFVTPGEAAAMCHPPTAEGVGLLAVHDSMPVFAVPSDRGGRDIHLGRIVWGERGTVTDEPFGVDVDEITHTLVAGATGTGKTTTLLRMVAGAADTVREVTTTDPQTGLAVTRRVPAGVLCLDWMRNFRRLAWRIDRDRFRFWSLTEPGLNPGGRRWRMNLLEIPHPDIDPEEWAGMVADLITMSYGLGEFARGIVWELINDLYRQNRLERRVIRAATVDGDGAVAGPEVALEPVPRELIPEGGIVRDYAGREVANVLTCPELSRFVGLDHLAAAVVAKIDESATDRGGKLMGTEMRNRLQTVWRRLQYFAPGASLAPMVAADPVGDPSDRAVRVPDLIDPDRGLVTVVEADGLDLQNRRLILGGLLLAVWRWGQKQGEGAFDHRGQGPGSFVVLEEAHELIGEQEGEDQTARQIRTSLYETMFRRSRALGLRLVVCVQNPGSVPAAVTSNVSTIISHRVYDRKDREIIAGLFNWERALGQHYREIRYLGELPVGWALVRLNPHTHYLQAAPVHIRVDPLDLPQVTDGDLPALLRTGPLGR